VEKDLKKVLLFLTFYPTKYEEPI